MASPSSVPESNMQEAVQGTSSQEIAQGMSTQEGPVTPRFPNIKISQLNQSFHTTECHISQKSQNMNK